MNAKHAVWSCAVIALIGAGVIFFTWRSTRETVANSQTESDLSSPAQSAENETGETIDDIGQFPDDPRPEVQLLYKLAKVANFWGFDPRVTSCETSSRYQSVLLRTPTHSATITKGILEQVFSIESSLGVSALRVHPNEPNNLYLATGNWSDKEAVAETIHILERLGDTNVLSQIAEGQPECEAVEYTVVSPTGQKVRVTPFYRVRLSDRQGRKVLEVHYRMGANGPAGLDIWHYWP